MRAASTLSAHNTATCSVRIFLTVELLGAAVFRCLSGRRSGVRGDACSTRGQHFKAPILACYPNASFLRWPCCVHKPTVSQNATPFVDCRQPPDLPAREAAGLYEGVLQALNGRQRSFRFGGEQQQRQSNGTTDTAAKGVYSWCPQDNMHLACAIYTGWRCTFQDFARAFIWILLVSMIPIDFLFQTIPQMSWHVP